MKFEEDELSISSGVRHGVTPRQPDRAAHRQHRVAEVGRGDERRAGRAHREVPRPRRRTHPAAARSRRPRRHAEVRLRRGAADPRARERPRDRRPRGARRRSRARSWPSSASVSSATPSRSAPSAFPRTPPLPASRRRRRAGCRSAALLRRRDVSALMVAEVDAARKDGDTLGGVVEVLAYGLPPGLGSHVHWDRRLDGKLAQALMSIQAIKGVEVGDGFLTTTRRGSQAHDELFATDDGITRSSDRAGGTEGGMSTGTVLRVRAGMKPIATDPACPADGGCRDRRHRGGASPALRRVRGARGRRGRRGHGRGRPRRGRAREVRRRQRRRDPPQPRVVPRGDPGEPAHGDGRATPRSPRHDLAL